MQIFYAIYLQHTKMEFFFLYKLDGNKHLTEQQKDDINNLAISWDLPPVSAENRRWLFQQLLHHAVRLPFKKFF